MYALTIAMTFAVAAASFYAGYRVGRAREAENPDLSHVTTTDGKFFTSRKPRAGDDD